MRLNPYFRLLTVRSGLHKLYQHFFIMAVLLLPTFALASGFGDDNSDELTVVLNGLITLLTSTYARLLMIIGIAGVGYLWMWKGTIPAGRAIGTIIGIGIVFSASFLCTALGIGGF